MRVYLLFMKEQLRKIVKHSCKIKYGAKTFVTVIKVSNENENIEKEKKSFKKKLNIFKI